MPCIHLLDGSCPEGSKQRNDCAGKNPELCNGYTSQYRKPGSNIKQCLFPGLNNLMARRKACTEAHPKLWGEAEGDLCNNCGGYDHDNFDWANPSIPVKGSPKPQVDLKAQELKPLPVNPKDLEIDMTCVSAMGVCGAPSNGCAT